MACERTCGCLLSNETVSEARDLIQSIHITIDLADANRTLQLNVIKTLSDLIELLSQNKRDSNYINDVRILNCLIATVKKIPRNVVLNQAWENIINLVSFLFWKCTTLSKVNRKLLQLIHELEQIFPESVFQYQVRYQVKLGCSTETSLYTLWSGLICQTITGKQLVTAQLPTILEVVGDQLSVYRHEVTWTVQRQKHLQALVKLIVDLLQHRKKDMSSTLVRTELNPSLFCSWGKIINSLLKLLQIEEVPKDCGLLVGTAVAQLVLLTSSPETCITDLCKLYYTLNAGGIMKFGSIQCTLCAADRGLVTFGHLSLLNGILAVSDAHILTCVVRVTKLDLGSQHTNVSSTSEEKITGKLCAVNNGGTSESKSAAEREEILLSWLHAELCQMTVLPGSQYQAFRLLSHYYYKLSRIFTDISKHTDLRLFAPQGKIMTEILNLIWTHLDSPVEGVGEYILEIFKTSLTLAQVETQHYSAQQGSCDTCLFASEFEALVANLLDKLISISWEARGRHNLLSILLTFTSIQSVLKRYPEIMNDVSQCLATNYLSPPVTRLYTSVADILSKMPDGLEIWRQFCFPVLLESLTSSHQLVRLNGGQHLLPVTFRKLPDSASVLQNFLEHYLMGSSRPLNNLPRDDKRKAVLHGFLAMLKTARNHQLLKEWPVAVLKEALLHPDNDIRLDAFCVICISPKKSEALSSTEIHLLQNSLIDNMNIDEPPFRQQLQTCIRHTVTRSRDTAIAALKCRQVSSEKETLATSLGYIQWLWCLCLHHLHPGCNYQRVKTCLDWASVILDCLTVQSDRRKGGCPEQTPALLEYAERSATLCLYTSQSCLALLSCVLHDTDEIKEQAAQILARYYPWPLPLPRMQQASYMSVESKLLQQAIKLCNSPRARETESGAVLCQLIFDKYIIGKGHDFMIQNENNKLHVHYMQTTSCENAAVNFMCHLVDLLEQSMKCTQSDILKATKTMPSHGLILACRQCLLMVRGQIQQAHKWQSFCQHLKTVSILIIDEVLAVLGANLESQDSAPSFEQMGLSVQSIIESRVTETLTCEIESSTQCELNTSNDACGRNETALPAEHQMVMTWCWLNIKECCLLLSTMAEVLPLGPNGESSSTVMSYSDVQTISDTLIKVLIKCRHRGAIEGCNQGFLRLCITLLSSPVQELFDIPSNLLDNVLSKLQKFSHTSVTRRSAGLPLIVQSILTSEAKTKQSRLLKKAITSLLTLVQEPVPANYNEQEDLPHVHALNIMKAIFREKSLSQSVIEYVSRVFILVIALLSSPLWAIRNSAMQLYGALQCRMLGQKKTASEELHTTTASEFFTQFPELHSYMLNKIKTAASSLSLGHLHLTPSLFPVLSVLAKLSPGVCNSDIQRNLDQFQKPVECLAASPLYSVRILSANALVAVVSEQKAVQYVVNLATQLPQTEEECKSYNNLHGMLLQLKLLVGAHRKCQVSTELFSALHNKHWLLTDENPCFMVKSTFLSLLTALNDHSYINNTVEKHAEELLSSEVSGTDGIKVGYSEYISKVISWWLACSSQDPLDKVTYCMRQTHVEIRLACLRWLDSCKDSLSNCDAGSIVSLLMDSLHDGTPWQELSNVLKLILDIVTELNYAQDADVCSNILTCSNSFWIYFMSLIHSEKCSDQAALSLSVSALVVKMSVGEKNSFHRLPRWCELLKNSAAPFNTDTLREHTAQAICMAGVNIIQHCRNDPLKHGAIFNLLDACLQLLQDEHSSIRNKSAYFVADLSTYLSDNEVMPLHYNTAQRKLLEIIPVFLPADVTTVSWLYGHISAADNLSETIKHACDKSIVEQFEASDINPYGEVVVYNTLFLACIKKLELCQNSAVSSWFEQELAALYKTAHSVSYLIKSPLGEILNVTYHKAVYEGLHSLSCQRDALTHVASVVSESSLLDDITRLLQVTDYHPCLQNINTTHL